MNYIKRIITIITIACFISSLSAQTTKRFEHKIIAGYNFGATAPAPLPEEVRSVNGYWPVFTPQLGYSISYKLNDKWGLQSGIQLESKGMGVRDKVKYMYTDVIMDDQNIRGYFSGKNETKVKISYVTIPLTATYQVTDKWSVRAGGYISYKSSGEFSGTVWDGYLRQTDDKDIINSMKIEIENKDDATFDFGNDIRDFDFGLVFGTERAINNKFGVTANFSWGLTPIFHSNFKGIDFGMHNLYLALGMTYKL
jgi:long-subunit fatty acid transport protein